MEKYEHKNNMEVFQDYLDAGNDIPREVFEVLSSDEQKLAEGMLLLKDGLKGAFNGALPEPLPVRIPDKVFRFPGAPLAKYTVLKYTAAAAAAFLIVFSGIRGYNSIVTRKLIREDTRAFVEALFEENTGENHIHPLGLSTDFFDVSLSGPLDADFSGELLFSEEFFDFLLPGDG